MQVSDPTTSAATRLGRTDEAHPPAPARHRVHHGGDRFRAALGCAGDGDPAAATAAAALVSAVTLARSAPLRVARPPARAPGPSLQVDRILVGSNGGAAEARIRIGSGTLAGAEIRLTAVAGTSAVTAQLLTPNAGSRQTLSVAMDEIRLRLQEKGIVLAPTVGRERPGAGGGGFDRGDSGAGGGWSGGR